jgi:guanyl-specific ribonuclease Sa
MGTPMRGRRQLGLLLAVVLTVVCVLLVGCGGGSKSSGESSQPAASQSAQNESDGSAGTTGKPEKSEQDTAAKTAVKVAENGTYTSKDEVAAYIYEFGHLPSNFITKDEAEDAGWKTKGRSLDEACPGKSIGGDKCSNREGKLPKAKGRTWTECDIDYHGEKSRGAKRLVFSNDGLIYYTGDHYKTFELLYGKES